MLFVQRIQFWESVGTLSTIFTATCPDEDAVECKENRPNLRGKSLSKIWCFIFTKKNDEKWRLNQKISNQKAASSGLDMYWWSFRHISETQLFCHCRCITWFLFLFRTPHVLWLKSQMLSEITISLVEKIQVFSSAKSTCWSCNSWFQGVSSSIFLSKIHGKNHHLKPQRIRKNLRDPLSAVRYPHAPRSRWIGEYKPWRNRSSGLWEKFLQWIYPLVN